jgi:DNA mismatch repair protein MutS2
MNLKPNDLYDKLEFDKVIALLKRECAGEIGTAYFDALVPVISIVEIERKLRETNELKSTLEKNDKFPFNTYYQIDQDLKMLAIEDYVLPIEGLQRINSTLLIFRDLFRFFTPIRKEIYPTLYANLSYTSYDEDLTKEISRVIDDDGNIKSDASSELIRIRKLMQSKTRELDRVYKSIITDFRAKGWLTDNVESFRNGRRVLSVPSEHKRKIRGIIHDESTTGKTAFIEPEGAIEVNNDLFDLETDERKEIYRILKDLSTRLRPYTGKLAEYQGIIGKMDVIYAKAKMAMKMKANMPKLVDAPHFGVKNARHPLLYLKNRAASKETIPFNLNLFKDNHLLVLSGPNAGGKSIVMKSVGLLQLMVQSGLLVPVHELSEMGIFHGIFAGIGDAQSIEDDLSTYSSHLQHMKSFLENTNSRSLVLIDEFGSGTDPKIGGAIAEGILKEINRKRCYGVVTTHYGNLKMFAYKTEGIVNACMNFDKDNLRPTYQMTIGRPGSSYAFEIAQKVGLDPKVIDYARKRVGANEQAVDTLLVDLQREKQELEEKLTDVTNKQKMLDKLIHQYDEQLKDVEFRRKKMKLTSKEDALQMTAKQNKEVELLMRQLREEVAVVKKNSEAIIVNNAAKSSQDFQEKLQLTNKLPSTNEAVEKAKEIAQTIKEKQVVLSEEVTQLTEDIYYQPIVKRLGDKKSNLDGEITAGDFVKLRTGGTAGKVESVDKKEAMVVMGDMRMKIKIRDLEKVNEPLEINKYKGIRMDTIETSTAFEPKIDIRGMNMTDAMRILESFLDQALLTSASTLRIVHGKGDGILRKIVKNKLKEYKAVKKSFHPEHFEGGDGVTLVEL